MDKTDERVVIEQFLKFKDKLQSYIGNIVLEIRECKKNNAIMQLCIKQEYDLFLDKEERNSCIAVANVDSDLIMEMYDAGKLKCELFSAMYKDTLYDCLAMHTDDLKQISSNDFSECLTLPIILNTIDRITNIGIKNTVQKCFMNKLTQDATGKTLKKLADECCDRYDEIYLLEKYILNLSNQQEK